MSMSTQFYHAKISQDRPSLGTTLQAVICTPFVVVDIVTAIGCGILSAFKRESDRDLLWQEYAACRDAVYCIQLTLATTLKTANPSDWADRGIKIELPYFHTGLKVKKAWQSAWFGEKHGYSRIQAVKWGVARLIHSIATVALGTVALVLAAATLGQVGSLNGTALRHFPRAALIIPEAIFIIRTIINPQALEGLWGWL